MVKTKIYIFQKYFDGYPKITDFKLIEKELPPIQDGEFLAEAVYLSVDPYMRAYSVRLPLGIPFIGSSVAKIIDSKNPYFPVGKYVIGNFNWQSHIISNGKATDGNIFVQDPYLLPNLGDIPVSTSLGILGMPGNTAYFGINEILKPVKGETVVISGAAGAVGHIVGQLCKLRGCKVIGISGSQEKGDWLINELGFDYFINYKNGNLDEELEKVTQEGIDCYFDNVGGDVSHSVMKQMNVFGRIAVCGAISGYNENDPKIPSPQAIIVKKQLTIQGLHVLQWLDRWLEGIAHNLQLVKEGKLKYKETITYGFDNMFEAFMKMLKGDNIGKAVVKV